MPLGIFLADRNDRTVILRFSRNPPTQSRKYRQIHNAFIGVAVILFLDSLYWAVTNISRSGYILPHVEDTLRNHWYVSTIKGLVLLSAVTFLVIVYRARAALWEEFKENCFWTFVNQTSDAIGILDADGRVRLWNKGAERLFGYREANVRGRHITEFLVPKDLHHEIDKILAEIRRTHQARQHYRTERQTAQGDRIFVDITISPIIEGKDFNGYFGIMREAKPRSLVDVHSFEHFKAISVSTYDAPYVFVAMPFSLEPAIWSAIQAAITAHNLLAVRADEGLMTGKIVDEIFNDILYARVVIADLTNSNPNVCYELGLAHVLNKQVIQIKGSEGHLPFDVAGIRTLNYKPSDLTELTARLSVHIQALLRSPQAGEG